MKNINDFLLELGFSPAEKGFDYTAAALKAFTDGYDGNLGELQEGMAKMAGCTRHTVERLMRYSIQKAVKRNPRVFRMIGLGECWEGQPLPVKVFLTAAARKLVGDHV